MQPERRILMVDDDEATCRVMRLLLEHEDYAFDVARSREEALDDVRLAPPDLMIIDYVMTGLAAEDFIHEVRTLGFEGPIVLCTAMHQHPELPVDDILLKPFEPDDLPERLRALLSATA